MTKTDEGKKKGFCVFCGKKLRKFQKYDWSKRKLHKKCYLHIENVKLCLLWAGRKEEYDTNRYDYLTGKAL